MRARSTTNIILHGVMQKVMLQNLLQNPKPLFVVINSSFEAMFQSFLRFDEVG